MSLTIDEQNVEELDRIFEELYKLTNKPFVDLKNDLDNILAGLYSINKKDLMPWHYHDTFFQETPFVYEVDLDKYYISKNLEKLAADFFLGIGLPVESILGNSDLFEKEGKNPHAFCTDIDREGDVRILCNLKDNDRWMETTLHELGHAVGLPHTFHNSFTSDFSNEVMGYYPGTHQFSEIVKQAYWSELVLNKIRYLQTITSSYDSNFVNIQETKFEELVSKFRSKDFMPGKRA